MPVSERLARADAVFEGRVVAVTHAASHGDREPPGALRASVEVVQTWKGADRERVVVTTSASGETCGVELEVGRSYLFFATTSGDLLVTSLCDGTRPREQTDDDVAELGAGVTPVDIEPGPTHAGDRSRRGASRTLAAGQPGAVDVRAGRRLEASLRERRRGVAATPPPGSGGCAGCAVTVHGRGLAQRLGTLALGVAVAAVVAARWGRRRARRMKAHRDA
jgi:hypothetical protein